MSFVTKLTFLFEYDISVILSIIVYILKLVYIYTRLLLILLKDYI